MDFAGGTPVHITSGTTVAAFVAFQLIEDRHRTQQPTILNRDAPHSVTNMVLGTAFLWIGWFGFNGGSALGGNMRAVSACASTHWSACAGGCTNLLLSWFLNRWGARQDIAKESKAKEDITSQNEASEDGVPQDGASQDIALEGMTAQDGATQDSARLDGALEDIKRLKEALQHRAEAWYPKRSSLSITHFCDGVIIGLVCITPGAGFVCHASHIHQALTNKIEGPCLELCNLRHCRRPFYLCSKKTRKATGRPP